MNTHALLKTIGGQSAIARECNVKDPAVSQWAANDEIPSARKQYLQLSHPGPHWADYEAYLVTKKTTTATPEVASHV